MHSMRVHEDTIVIVVIWVNSRAGSDGLVKHGNPFQVAIVFPRAGMMFMRSLLMRFRSPRIVQSPLSCMGMRWLPTRRPPSSRWPIYSGHSISSMIRANFFNQMYAQPT